MRNSVIFITFYQSTAFSAQTVTTLVNASGAVNLTSVLKMFVHVFCLAFLANVALTVQIFNGRPIDGFVPRTPEEMRLKATDAASVKNGTFTQILDHFDYLNNQTWEQVYLVNDEFYTGNGPMFVMISGEAPIDPGWMQYGQWYKNAEKFGAIMYQLEHRFYGNSHPTKDASTENLQYLSSEQALADLDAFIQSMMKSNDIDKVIVFGGSYAGNLAAWYRTKYDTALGSIASSAPVTAVLDFYQYMETVGYVMDYFRPGCYNATQEAFSTLASLISQNSLDQVNELFKPCPPGLNAGDETDISTFFTMLIEPWKGSVQYTAPDLDNSNIGKICNVMLNESQGTILERLSNIYTDYNQLGYNNNHLFGNVNCTPHDYKGMINQLRMSDWSATVVVNGARQWTWQTCSEFGYYQTTDSNKQPFGQHESVEYWIENFCTEVFGTTLIQLKQTVDRTNIKYGATNGRERKVFLANGSLDPWHNLGIYHLPPDSTDTVAFIKGTSHCYDMDGDLPTDPKQLTEVRANITQQISIWLSDSTPSSSTNIQTNIFLCIFAFMSAFTFKL